MTFLRPFCLGSVSSLGLRNFSTGGGILAYLGKGAKQWKVDKQLEWYVRRMKCRSWRSQERSNSWVSGVYRRKAQRTTREKRERIAAKADDAEVPEYLWLEHMMDDSPFYWSNEQEQAVTSMIAWFRKRMLRWWKNKVRTSFEKYLEEKYPQLKNDSEMEIGFVELTPSETGLYGWKGGWIGRQAYKRWWTRRLSICGKDWAAGGDAIMRAAKTTWWNWDDGSRHWRWPGEYQDRIRDGIPVHFKHVLKPYRVAQGDERDPVLKDQLILKLQKARDRQYIAPEKVILLTSFFGVKKGEDNVRPVYDGLASGLNKSMWMPRLLCRLFKHTLDKWRRESTCATWASGKCF
jgi:hypothetical protein